MTPAEDSSASTVAAGTVRGDLALLGLTLFWGSTFPVVRAALRDVSPNAFLVARFAVGAFGAVLLARGKLAHRPSLKAGLALGVVLYAGFAFQTVGLRFTTSTRSAFITSLSVLLVPPLAYGLFRKTFHVANYVGVGIATVGLFVLSSPLSDGVRGLLVGDALTLGCAVAFALHIIMADRWAPQVHPTSVTAVQVAVAAALSLAAVPFEHARWEPTGPTVAAIVYTGILGSAAALSIQIWGQARTTAIRAALIFALEPVFATVFASVLAGDVIHPNELGGGGLVVLGVVVGQVGPPLAARLFPGGAGVSIQKRN